MKTLLLADLPPPPPGRTGWPWTVASPPVPETAPGGTPWPRITIVTPSFNQGQFLEETIRSVLLQGYPNLEYIIIDGGSNDNSVEIINKYKNWISYWISEKDRGQAHAINKGIDKSTGEVLAWLNSDDVYYCGILEKVGISYNKSEDRSKFWKIYAVDYYDYELQSHVISPQGRFYALSDWVLGVANMNQQATFWARQITQAIGSMNEKLHYAFDNEYWMRMISRGYNFDCDDVFVGACWRVHDDCKWKSQSVSFRYEWAKVALQYNRDVPVDQRRDTGAARAEMAFNLIRMAQRRGLKKGRRLRYLAMAIFYKPQSLVDRAWLSTVNRYIIRADRV